MRTCTHFKALPLNFSELIKELNGGSDTHPAIASINWCQVSSDKVDDMIKVTDIVLFLGTLALILD